MQNLELDLLRSFAAVADTGSFTAAGELVARTQSAVSMQIKRLEETLGRRVFERSSRALALTSDGALLLGYARRMLQLNDESLRTIARPPVTGRARLGVTEYFVPNELPRILSRFAAAHPGVQLDVRMGLSRDLRVELDAGRLDAAIVRLQKAEKGATPLWRESQVWVAAEEWTLGRGQPIPLVALPQGCVLREFAMDTFKRQEREWHLAYTGSSMASVQAAVLAGLGVSIVSQSTVVPGMQVLRGRGWPDPGALDAGVVKGAGARDEIVAALASVAREALAVIDASRRRA
jgi:DNA-binding transcriptional LysR family regulator